MAPIETSTPRSRTGVAASDRAGPREAAEILRFREAERAFHWSMAIPFMLCFSSAFVLVVFYNPFPARPFRAVFSWTHRLSGLALIVMPVAAAIRHRYDWRVHVQNVRQAWIWTLEDLRWLSLMGLAAVSSRYELPEQGKFNAAEKLNFMMVMTTIPLFILTGLLIWMPGIAIYSWLMHFGMAVMIAPLMLGHIFMATVNPDTRIGLRGMFSGYVDREWARHHYGRWFRENFENGSGAGDAHPAPASPAPPSRPQEWMPTDTAAFPAAASGSASLSGPLDGPVLVLCRQCGCRHPVGSWADLIRAAFDADLVSCPRCGARIGIVPILSTPPELELLLSHIETAGISGPVSKVIRRAVFEDDLAEEAGALVDRIGPVT